MHRCRNIRSLNSCIKKYQDPLDNRSVPIKRSSLKLEARCLGEVGGDLFRSHFRAARGVEMESKK